MSPTSRIIILTFWEYLAFLASSLIFLLSGLDVNLPSLLAMWQPVLWAILAILLARIIVIYGLNGLLNPFVERIPKSWFHVLHWGGLRGAIALAMVLSLPATFDDKRELMKLMAFGVVLFTLLIQSTTMRSLLHRLGLVIRLPEDVEFEKRHARLTAARASLKHMERRHAEGLLSSMSGKYFGHVLAPRLRYMRGRYVKRLSLRRGLRLKKTIRPCVSICVRNAVLFLGCNMMGQFPKRYSTSSWLKLMLRWMPTHPIFPGFCSENPLHPR